VALAVFVLVAHAVLLFSAFFLENPDELWVWGCIAAAGSIVGLIIFLNSGLGKRLDVFRSFRVPYSARRSPMPSKDKADSVVRLGLCLIAVAMFMKASDGLGELTVSQAKTDVLAGRLTISVPNGARSATAPRSIMAAAQSQAKETRIIIDAGKQRIALIVTELFAHEGGDFVGEAREEIGPLEKTVRVQERRLSGRLRVVQQQSNAVKARMFPI
jgi:hypothetical protein